jgi:putative nucleotidyltransferase with HDIG domain
MYLVIPLIEVLFCLTLLIVLMISGKRHVARRPFTLFLVFMALWGLFIFMMRAATDMSAALLWEKFVFWAILSASLFFYRFTVSVTGSRLSKKIDYPLYALYFVILGLIPTGLIVKGMQMMWYGKAPIIGPLFPFYVLGVYIPLIISLRMLIRQWRRSRFIDERIRAQYIVFGIAAMFVGGTTDYLPALGVNLYPFGIIGNILFCLSATIAMLKHNLLEMKVIFRKAASYTLASVLILGIFGCLIFLLSYIFQDFMSPVSLTITIIAVFIAALLFQPVLSRLQQMVDKWFFRERYDHIQSLKNFNRKTKGDLDLEQISSSLVTTIANGMMSQGVYLLVPSSRSGNFTTYAYSGQKSKGRLYFTSRSPLVETMRQQNYIIDHNDIDIIPSLLSLTNTEREAIEKNNIELLVPLRNNGHLSGMLLISSKMSLQPYSNEERKLLHLVSDEVASNIENANLYADMKQRQSELLQAMNGVIHAISLVVESRDPYTAGHQRRVAELAKAIAREMGLSDWQTMGIYITGLLHDVGKVAVPSEILSKPGKINRYEFSIIKNHSRIGYDILQRIDFPWPVTKSILQHHERLDGSGYPEGLAGDDIIIEARILGVADVVEAMSSHRPYRPALGLEAALQEITKSSGILYDPEVVDACLKLLSNNEPEFDRLMAEADAKQEYNMEALPV